MSSSVCVRSSLIRAQTRFDERCSMFDPLVPIQIKCVAEFFPTLVDVANIRLQFDVGSGAYDWQ